MKNKLLGFLLSALLLLGFTSPASAYLNNWWFDIDGAGGNAAVQVFQDMDITARSLVDTDYTAGDTTYNFSNYGFVKSSTYDGGTDWNSNYELTGIFTFTGSADLTTGVNTFTGGTFDIWVGSSAGGTKNYATDTADPVYFGANDGIKIASFAVQYGEGSINATGFPNGALSIKYENTFFEEGYFFLPDGTTDMKYLPSFWLILGETTTNASNTGLTDLVKDELIAYSGYGGIVPDTPPFDFWLASGGQLRLELVPEPTTFLLFGLGLLGVAGVSRRRKN